MFIDIKLKETGYHCMRMAYYATGRQEKFNLFYRVACRLWSTDIGTYVLGR